MRWSFRSRHHLGTGLLFGLLVAAWGMPAWAQNGKSAKAKARLKAAGRLADPKQRNDAAKSETKLPKNLEWSKAKKMPGRTNLPLGSDKNLGKPLTAEQLDELVAQELIAGGIEKAEPRTSDDQFIRRLYLDVIGQPPAPADIEEYVNDPDPQKKAKLIDRLLDLPQYGTNWARYWRDVIITHATAGENRQLPFQHAEDWLAEQFNKNVSWDVVVENLIEARGISHDTPQGFFLAAHEAKPEEVIGEVSRIFLGIQISCAQCHDHPNDHWKRDQFHEMAAFFGRTLLRPRRDLAKPGMPFAVEIGERPRGDYRKPDLEDPTRPGEVVTPVFLTGQSIPLQTSDAQRRKSLATFITSKRNPFFAKAFVNRIWYELMGYGFTNPVDDLGAANPVAYPKLFDALARSFAASNYDIKRLMRTVLNSKLYDRAFRHFEGSSESHELFKSINPTRLSADQIFDAIDWVLGNIDDGQQGNFRRPNPRMIFRQTFGFDPSLDKAAIEGSIPQALVLMNSPMIQARISANREGTLLYKLLKHHANDADVVRTLYLRVLARKPSSQEVETALQYLRDVGKRGEAFEDLLWALMNSTEFLYNH